MISTEGALGPFVPAGQLNAFGEGLVTLARPESTAKPRAIADCCTADRLTHRQTHPRAKLRRN